MATTTFNGAVRSENGFEAISVNATTGTVTTSATYGANATVVALTATGAVTFSNASVIMSALPTADPSVAGQLWANTGIVTVSAG